MLEPQEDAGPTPWQLHRFEHQLFRDLRHLTSLPCGYRCQVHDEELEMGAQ